MRGRKPIDLSGRVFGLLTVIDRVGTGIRTKSALWRCACACGNEIVVGAEKLRKTPNRNCGCVGAHFASLPPELRNDPAYTCWTAMINRCETPSTGGYARYGGRGITICKAWRECFRAFLADLGPRPSPTHTLERIDNDGHYEPGNVRWATWKEQARNRSTNVFLEFNGQRLILADWVPIVGLPFDTLSRRSRDGWSAERILTTPIKPQGDRGTVFPKPIARAS